MWNPSPAPATTTASASSPLSSSMISITQTALYKPAGSSNSLGQQLVSMSANSFDGAGDISAPSGHLQNRVSPTSDQSGKQAELDTDTEIIENLELLHPSQFNGEEMNIDLIPFEGPPVSTHMSPQKPLSRLPTQTNKKSQMSAPTVVKNGWQAKPQKVVNDEKLMQLKVSNEEKEDNDLGSNQQAQQTSSTTEVPTSSASVTTEAKEMSEETTTTESEMSENITNDEIKAEDIETTENETETATVSKKINDKSMEDITMVSDLSRLTFHNEDFPKSNEKKLATSTRLKISKTELPLKAGVSPDDFLFLHPINSDGQRRSPIRTYRPHVRTQEVKERDSPSIENSITVADDDYVGTEAFLVGHTTTASPRRDLPAARKIAESMTHKVDNAHSVDEETNASPFEEESSEALAANRADHALSRIHDNLSTRLNISFQGDEDIEDVILKLSSPNLNIRRAPVRESQPREQFEKHALETENDDLKQLQDSSKDSFNVHKDGSRTHVPSGMRPIAIPEMAIFEKEHEGENILEELAEIDDSDEDDEEDSGEDDDVPIHQNGKQWFN
ncbi:unnamed protein product [Strongylus vulgaris]|uniref:Uncharacterized protein n=1 Tax=Strongylus vulgaris TaxID=40348 RepID=A0A3P7JE31_STRVU|nr:unnamed protein product [Strongylus vulgaris]